MSEVNINVSDKFVDYINDWDYVTYVVMGGYGSGKSWDTALKIILKCLEEVRTVLVCRDVYDTIRESCFSLFKDILDKLDLLADEETSKTQRIKKNKVIAITSPMQIKFPNGSRIIFKGLDKPSKVKSIHGVSIVWIEEASEIKFEAYEELVGRVRENNTSLHFILTFNPVGRENWTYNRFFKHLDDDGNEIVILDEQKLYDRKTIVKNGVYYHHSTPDDNPFLPDEYIKRLDELKTYDPNLWRVARLGMFGANGTRVLPQFEVAQNAKEFKYAVMCIPDNMRFIGFDFGFEESYNAVVSCAVDDKNKILYIYDEIYINHVTDDKMANLPEMLKIKEADKLIIADAEDPKAIQYYRQMGYRMKKCKKFAGSRLANTRKIKRFKRIICSPKCKNCIRELRDLTYKKDSKGNVIYDEFSIDPHTFSALWYALDNYNVADLKIRESNSVKGGR